MPIVPEKVLHVVRAISSKLFSRNRSVSDEIFGFRVELDLRENIQWMIWTRSFEPVETKWVRAFLKPGMRFVDVGSNVGYFSLLASSLVGSSGKVFAFEPSDIARRTLESAVRNNGIKNIEISPCGLGDEKIVRRLYDAPDSTHSPSFVATEGDLIGSCEIVTYDDWAASSGVGVADLVKIDVEGFEPNVLRGMRESMKAGKVRAILIEASPGWLNLNQSSPDELLELLKSSGYQVHWQEEYPGSHTNYLLTR